MLTLASTLSLPQEAVTQTFALLARRGAGKTYTAMLMAEQMLDDKQPIVVIDPVGVWHGLRSHFSIAILGGEHGDIPLEATGGKLVAEFVVSERLPVILDVSQFGENEMRRFVGDFCGTLYRLNKEPLHVFLDEADEFAPQEKSAGAGPACLGAIQQIVRRGRARGLGVTLITQRSAVLNKSVLTQTEVLIAMQTTGPQDLAAIRNWLKYHADDEQQDEILSSLPKLQQGHGWVYSPGWLKILQQVHFNRKRSMDTSHTPKVGEKRKAPRSLKDVDLQALTTKMAATIERAKASDPMELQKQIAALKKELAVKPKETIGIKAVDAKALEKARQAGWEAGKQEGYVEGYNNGMESLEILVKDLYAAVKVRVPPSKKKSSSGLLTYGEPIVIPPAVVNGQQQSRRVESYNPNTRTATIGSVPNGEKLPKAERAILTVLAQYPNGRTKVQVAVICGYSHNGGGFNNSLSALRSRGLLTGSSNLLLVTPAGLVSLGSYEPLPTGQALINHWCSTLGKAEREVLKYLTTCYPQAVTKELLAEATGYAHDGGGFNNALSKLRTLELIAGRGMMTASDVFFT